MNLLEHMEESLNFTKDSKAPAVIMMVVLVLAVCLILGGISFNSLLTLIITGLVIAVTVVAIKPTWAIYIMALTLPLINLNIYMGPFILPVIDLVGLIGLAGFGLHILISQDKFLTLKFPFFIPFFIFWLATLASVLISEHPLDSLWYSVRWILFFYLAYVFLPVNVIKDKKTLKKTLVAFVLSGFIMAVMGVISLKDQNFPFEPIRFTVLSFNGVQPFGLDQNLLVEVLLPSVFFLLALFVLRKKELEKKVIILILLFIAFVLIGTFSRGAWISLFVFSLLYLLFNERIQSKKVIITSAIAFMVLVPMFFYMFSLQRTYNVGISSTQTRLLSTQIAWENFLESPWLGKGTGEYVSLINDNIRFRAQHGEGTDSNGIIQKVMAENGVVGLGAFALLSGYIFSHLFSRRARTGKERLVLICISLGAASIFLFEFFNTSYYHGKMWFPIGVAWATYMLFTHPSFYDKDA